MKERLLEGKCDTLNMIDLSPTTTWQQSPEINKSITNRMSCKMLDHSRGMEGRGDHIVLCDFTRYGVEWWDTSPRYWGLIRDMS